MLQALVAVAFGFPPDLQVTPVFLVALALLGDSPVALAVGEALAFAVAPSVARFATVFGTLALAPQLGVTALVGHTVQLAGLLALARPLAGRFTLAIGAALGIPPGLGPLFGLATVRGATVLEPLFVEPPIDVGLVALLCPASPFRLLAPG